MAAVRKTLGQAKPASNTLTDLYVCPASTSAVSSTLYACNQSASPSTFRVAKAIAGAADALAQYLYFDTSIPPKSTFAVTTGIVFAATDVLRVSSDTGEVSFTLDGEEKS